MSPRRKKTSSAPMTPLVWMLLGAFTFVAVAAALYEVIPRSSSSPDSGNLTELKQRLDGKEHQRREVLQKELDGWGEKNNSLRQEIKRLKEGKK